MRVLDPRAGAVRSFLWGVAQAFDPGGSSLPDRAWDGPAADAEALAGDWRAALRTLRLADRGDEADGPD